LLLTISKNYLMGEGDIIRHLVFMGYSVLHTQAPLDEFDFTVKNLAVDLRDGVRLCRLVDLHCPELNLSMVSSLCCYYRSEGSGVFFYLFIW
jgi:abnormal spindle-like microcephaly-associated protein